MEHPTVAEWLQGKDILITGATGFMGKVLVEKLLRCAPGINRMYLIIRTKRGSDATSRMEIYKTNQLFGPLLNQFPNAFDKVVAIPGDMSELKCGLSKEHQQELKDNVAIVFHTAASVRFDDSLTPALKLNTRGTYELTEMAKEMKKLEVFQYVSTTYCNANLNEQIEEKVYPSHMDWKTLLKILEQQDDGVIDTLVYKILGTQLNTYTLTKSLAENIVLEASKVIPAVIVRPSVVIPILFEPLPGWTENLNGVVGVTVGVSKGVLRVFKCSPTAALDYIPVDVAISGMVTAAWARRFHDDGQLQIYNEVYDERVPVTFNDIVQNGVKINGSVPMENYVWYPFMIVTNNTYYYHFLFYFLQLIPALFLDAVLTVAGRKRFLVKLNIKIYNAAMALSDFTDRPFTFANSCFCNISSKLNPHDKSIYKIDEDEAANNDSLQLMILFQQGLKRYMFHEKDEDLDRYKLWHWRLYYIDRITRGICLSVIAWYGLLFIFRMFNRFFEQTT